MIKTVVFISKDAFINHLKREPGMIAISIGSDGEGKPPSLHGFAGGIRLVFEDIYEERSYLEPGDLPDLHPDHERGVRLFLAGDELCDYNDALKIVRFLDHYASKEGEYHLIVHCQAGISRSSAVARFAVEHYGCQLDNANGDFSKMNRRLYRLLVKVRNNENPVIGIVVIKPKRERGQATSVGLW